MRPNPIQIPSIQHLPFERPELSPDAKNLLQYSLKPSTEPTPQPDLLKPTVDQNFKVPKPPNAFLLFRREKVATDKSIQALPLAEASKRVSQLWQSVSKEERERFEAMAKDVRKQHRKMFNLPPSKPKKRSVQNILLPPIIKKRTLEGVSLKRKRTNENEEAVVGENIPSPSDWLRQDLSYIF